MLGAKFTVTTIPVVELCPRIRSLYLHLVQYPAPVVAKQVVKRVAQMRLVRLVRLVRLMLRAVLVRQAVPAV